MVPKVQPKAVFTGDLQLFAVPDLLDFLESSRRTGTLVITSEEGIGAVYLHQGRPHRVVRLDLDEGVAVVEPGVTLAELDARLAVCAARAEAALDALLPPDDALEDLARQRDAAAVRGHPRLLSAAAIGSPTYRTRSRANTGWSWLIRPYVGTPGTSSAVTTSSNQATSPRTSTCRWLGTKVQALSRWK